MSNPNRGTGLDQACDVLVIGSGAAGLTAALAAATANQTSTTTIANQQRPLKILLIDKAPASWAGGNGYFTAAAYRVAHAGLKDLLPLVSNVPESLRDQIDLPTYSEQDFLQDLVRVTDGRSDRVLGERLVKESLDLVQWLRKVAGVDWWLSFRRQAYEFDGRWAFWGGLHLTVANGGKGLIADLMRAVKAAGVEIVFDTSARKLLTDTGGTVCGAEVESKGKTYQLSASSVILCAGGFEADPQLRGEWMGPGWERAHTRGTPYNTGDMLVEARRLGAKLAGDFSPSGCHSVAWDADSPKGGGDREKTNEFTKSGYPLGLMLNTNGERFVDEGVDLRNYTYAKFGRAILEQPDGIAFQIWDHDGQQWLRPEEYRDDIVRKIQADSISELAQKLTSDGLRDPDGFVCTVTAYNAAVAAHRAENPSAKLNPAIKDGLSTQSSSSPSTNLDLAKSNWALPILKPPFLAVKVTSGITFTFGGLAINPDTAAVLRQDGSPIEGLYCAGEMVGGLFYGNYPGGSGLTAGGVFGRKAGQAAVDRLGKKGA